MHCFSMLHNSEIKVAIVDNLLYHYQKSQCDPLSLSLKSEKVCARPSKNWCGSKPIPTIEYDYTWRMGIWNDCAGESYKSKTVLDMDLSFEKLV